MEIRNEMKFSEKLIYLMEMTGTSNKQLASQIHVDPSMISLIRTGRRGKPRNLDHIRAMAKYFADRSTVLYPFETLRENVAAFNLKYHTHLKDTREVLYEWLRNDTFEIPDYVDAFLHGLTTNAHAPFVSHDAEASSAPNPVQPFLLYGHEGKGDAIAHFFKQMLAMESTGTLYIASDESTILQINNENAWDQIMDWCKELIQKGFRITMILPPFHSPMFYEVFIHWVPLFLTGSVDVFYYPRMRDQVHRRTLLIYPDHLLFSSQSMAMENESAYSIIATDPTFIAANLRMFTDFLLTCQRTLIRHTSWDSITDCFIRYGKCTENIISGLGYLPSGLLPADKLSLFYDGNEAFTEDYFPVNTPDAGELTRYISQNKMLSRQNYSPRGGIDSQPLVVLDICQLPTVAQVLAGEATLYLPHKVDMYRHVYTPYTYYLHLKRVVEELETNPYFFLVPIPYQGEKDVLMVREDRMAIMMRLAEPTTVYEISQPQLVQPFFEHLRSISDHYSYSGTGKQQIISQLKKLMQELKPYLPAEASD